jgi:peptidoglycan/xylan/chitin deacetylase (PgdA/CDA1 family)
MAGNAWVGVRRWRWAALGLGLLTWFPAQQASAADCPGHPDALGTSRTLVVDPKQHPRIGTMQYAETLPLGDHEVVLTFDDGPLPRNSNQILEILAAQCVKATFFIIGRMAQSSPEGVRKLRDAGHSIGTHTQNHPLGMNKMSIEHARQEIDDGIASVKAALGDDAALAPFFRIPGLSRAEAVEDYLASEGIQTWSADFPADDWRHISSSRVYDLAIKRLEDKGKGILLLHDIQARTVAALPRLLNELKARGYRIVHVVPATSELPATPTEPEQWLMHPASETVAISRWPKIPRFAFASTETLVVPAVSDSYWNDDWPTPSDLARRQAGGVPLPRQAPWPQQTPQPPANAATVLPAPAQSIFEIKDSRALALAAARSQRQAEQRAATEHAKDAAKLVSAEAGASRRAIAGKSRVAKSQLGRVKRAGVSHAAGRGIRHAAHPVRRALKRVVQVKRRSV